MRSFLLGLFLLLTCTTFVKSQANFIHQDSVLARSSSCLLGISACIDSFQYEDINKYNFFLNNSPYAASNVKYCTLDSIFGYSYFFLKGRTGPFTLTNWNVNNRLINFTFSDINILKDSMRRWTNETPNWIYSADNTLIYQINSGSLNLQSQVINSSGGTVRDTVGLNRGILYQGARVSVTSGINKFVAQRKADNVKDSVTIVASCFAPSPKSVRFTLASDSAGQYCADTSNFIARIKSVVNICSKTADPILKINSILGSCINYKTVGVGVDTLCIKVCDVLGFCDTTQLIITVLAKNQTGLRFRVTDSIFVDSSKQRCDVLIPQGKIVSRQRISFNNPLTASFSLVPNSSCINFAGVNPGLDSTGVIVCNSDNICDTTILIVKVIQKPVQKSKKYYNSDRVAIGSTSKTCLNLPQQTTTVTRFNNYCSASSKGNVTFTQDDVRQCIFYSGVKVGLDTACFEICNNLGICDTSYFYIESFSNKVDTTPVLLPRVDTVKIKINQTVNYCPDTTRLVNSPITNIGYCQLSNFDNVSIALDNTKKCVTIKGLKVGVDTFCLVLKNQAGFSDTTKLFVKVLPDTLRTQVRFDSLSIFDSDSANYCYTDTSFLGAKVDTFYNSCPNRSGNSSQITQVAGTRCFKINGLFAGIDTICFRACSNKTNLCDSLILFVNVKKKDAPKLTKIDSVKVNVFGNVSYCLSNLSTGTILSFCSSIEAKKSTKVIKNNCVNFTGNAAGKDTVCVLACKPSGICDTTKLFVTVTPDTAKAGSRQKNLIIKIGADTTICLDTTILRSPVDTFFDNCNGKNGLFARISPQVFTRCIQIKGVKAGTDTACYVICNKTRTICDTTIYVVQVIDTAKVNLRAFDDFDTTRLNKTKDIIVFSNDSLGGRLPTSLTIVAPPTKGVASVISITKGIINYVTLNAPQSCGIDSFRYRVCVGTTCSEATVTVNVLCADSLIVFNAISPNGDGINDNFVIDGLQNYVNNTLLIFNRWGNQVLKAKNYQNDWSGTWDGKNLPDGTYYYFLYDDAKNILLKNGYIQINR